MITHWLVFRMVDGKEMVFSFEREDDARKIIARLCEELGIKIDGPAMLYGHPDRPDVRVSIEPVIHVPAVCNDGDAGDMVGELLAEEAVR